MIYPKDLSLGYGQGKEGSPPYEGYLTKDYLLDDWLAINKGISPNQIQPLILIFGHKIGHHCNC